jgi:hypothetical protein
MNCCLGSSAKYAPVDTSPNGVGKPADVCEGFPAVTQRAQFEMNVKRKFYSGKALVQSGGNALMEYNEKTMANLVRVTVPEGCWESQIIQVTVPHGPGSAYVRIPLGCLPGSTFLVNISNEQGVNDLHLKEDRLSKEQSVAVETSKNNKEIKDSSMILVDRPPGMEPGSTIYVQTPDNNERVLAVEVPVGNEPKFYVEYDRNTFDDTKENDGGDGDQCTSKSQTIHSSQAGHVLPGLT